MTENFSWTTIDALMERLLKNDIAKRISKADVIDYTTEFIQLLPFPAFFFDNVAEIEIEDHVGYLPSGVFSVEGVINKSQKYRYIKSTSFSLDVEDKEYRSHGFYQIKGNVIYVSNPDTVVVIKYMGLPIDDHEQILIPSSPLFITTLCSFIIKTIIESSYNTYVKDKFGLANYQNVERNYTENKTRLISRLLTPSPDEMMYIANQLNALMPRRSEFLNDFKNSGEVTYINKHNV